MTPTFCVKHGWTDGPCEPGKRRLTRKDFFERVKDIDAMLGDDESCQSRGYFANKALEAEKAQLQVLLGAVK